MAHRAPGDLASVLGIPATPAFFQGLGTNQIPSCLRAFKYIPPFCLKYYIDPDIHRYTHIYLHILTIEIIKHIHTNNTNLSSSMAPVAPPPAQIILKPIPDILWKTLSNSLIHAYLSDLCSSTTFFPHPPVRMGHSCLSQALFCLLV